MAAEITDWLNLVFRFAHVLAAIMWVGSSIFFMWLDFHLEKPEAGEEDEVEGRLWMIHGGGIFHAEKRLLSPDQIPKNLHWFKWEAYSTWLTGFFLLATIHYLNGGVSLPGSSGISGGAAVLYSLGMITGGWMVYDLMWRTKWFRHNSLAGSAISFGVLILAAIALCDLFNGRAAYLHVGAILGTLMAGNVFFHIIPNQRVVMKALEAGKEHDIELSKHAKLRSTHNNYMTFPVIFLMISFHYPKTYGSEHSWAVLAAMIIGLATIRHFMNIRGRFKNWLPAAIGTFFAMAVIVGLLTRPPVKASAELSAEAKAGRSLFTSLACATCHVAQAPTLAPRLEGVFGTPQKLADGTEVIADEAYLKESILQPHAKILHGYQPVMTPYQGAINDQQLDQLVAYLKAL